MLLGRVIPRLQVAVLEVVFAGTSSTYDCLVGLMNDGAVRETTLILTKVAIGGHGALKPSRPEPVYLLLNSAFSMIVLPSFRGPFNRSSRRRP